MDPTLAIYYIYNIVYCIKSASKHSADMHWIFWIEHESQDMFLNNCKVYSLIQIQMQIHMYLDTELGMSVCVCVWGVSRWNHRLELFQVFVLGQQLGTGAFWGGEAWLLHTHLVGNTNFVAYAWVHFQQACVCAYECVFIYALPCCCCCSFKFSFAVFLVFFYLFCLHFSCCCCCSSCLNELTDSSWNLLIDELDKQSLFLWAAFGLANELIKKQK